MSYPKSFVSWVEAMSTKDILEVLWNRMSDQEKEELQAEDNLSTSESEEVEEEEEEDKWMTVYQEIDGVDDYCDDSRYLTKFKTKKQKNGTWKTIYYQTFGGGPEGGFFWRCFFTPQGVTESELYAVTRSWGQAFRPVLLRNSRLELQGSIAQSTRKARLQTF